MVQWRTSLACLREPPESIRRGILVLVLVRSHRCQSVRFMGRMGTKTFGRIDCRWCTVPRHRDSTVGGLRIRLREICMSPDFQNMSGDGGVRCVGSNRNDSVCVGVADCTRQNLCRDFSPVLRAHSHRGTVPATCVLRGRC